MTDPSAHFAPDYARARERFRAAAEARGARVESHVLARRGRAGEELAVDAAWLGPEAPARALVVSSGIHGAEGFAGSAIQHRLLAEQWDGLALPADTGLLVVHALNPFGFSHGRRVNESNVDLNRNFVAHPDGHEPNPLYERLHPVVNPERLDDESERALGEALAEFVREHGFPTLQEVLTRGQYVHPEGVQFGGARDEASNRVVRALARSATRGARRVAWVDLHTGLGPWGEVEMIFEVEPDHPWYRRGRAWYGEAARSTLAGESVSAPLCGVLELGLADAFDPEVELTPCAAEFGTYEPVRVFRAMRADNWLHQHGDPDSGPGRAITAEVLEVFAPAAADWRARVLDEGARVVERTRDGLCA